MLLIETPHNIYVALKRNTVEIQMNDDNFRLILMIVCGFMMAERCGG